MFRLIKNTLGEAIELDLNQVITVSYSSLGLLSSCPRKFSLYKIYPDGEFRRDESAALSQGKAVGLGYARWLELEASNRTCEAGTGYETLAPKEAKPTNLEEAMLETWRGYYPNIEDNVRNATKAAVIVKSLAKATEGQMDNWHLATLNGKPCVETSFCIKLCNATGVKGDDNYIPPIYFVGFLDAILEHTTTGFLKPLELKTSSLTNYLKENFLNSAQGNGYGLILDTVRKLQDKPIGLNYEIQYLVAQVHRAKAEQYIPTIHSFTYTKTILDRLEWLLDLKLSQQKLQAFLNVSMFPRNGSNCLAWNRLCAYSGICNLTNSQEPRWYQLDGEKNKDVKPDLATYDFYFDIQELITDAVNLAADL